MVERRIEVSVREKSSSGIRSPLLMPIIEGNTLGSDDVADFLKCRLSLLLESSSSRSSVRLS